MTEKEHVDGDISAAKAPEPKRDSKLWKRALKKAAVITLLLTPFIWTPLNRALLNSVLFGPLAYPNGAYNTRSVAGVVPEDVYLKGSDGKKFHGWMLKNPKEKYTVLMSHGLGGNMTLMTDVMALFVNSGASVFVYDYEGYGRSEGSPTVEVCCDDAKSAYNYLIGDQKVDPKKLVLFGESFGTGITTNLSMTAKSAGIILQCPFISLRDRAIEIFALEAAYPQSFYPENALDNRAVLTKTHAPLLVIGGVEDPILPIRHADTVAASALEPKTYLRIEGVGHSGDPRLARNPMYASGLKTFLTGILNTSAILSSSN